MDTGASSMVTLSRLTPAKRTGPEPLHPGQDPTAFGNSTLVRSIRVPFGRNFPLPVTCLFGVGAIYIFIHRRETPIDLSSYLWTTMVAYMVFWPYREDPRYLFPTSPMAIIVAVYWLSATGRAKWIILLPYALVAAISLVGWTFPSLVYRLE